MLLVILGGSRYPPDLPALPTIENELELAVLHEATSPRVRSEASSSASMFLPRCALQTLGADSTFVNRTPAIFVPARAG